MLRIRSKRLRLFGRQREVISLYSGPLRNSARVRVRVYGITNRKTERNLYHIEQKLRPRSLCRWW